MLRWRTQPGLLYNGRRYALVPKILDFYHFGEILHLFRVGKLFILSTVVAEQLIGNIQDSHGGKCQTDCIKYGKYAPTDLHNYL